jgi:hypothetical protein
LLSLIEEGEGGGLGTGEEGLGVITEVGATIGGMVGAAAAGSVDVLVVGYGAEGRRPPPVIGGTAPAINTE